MRLLRTLNPGADWTMLSALRPAKWQPNPGWKTGAPRYLPTEIAARSLGLRFNHPAAPTPSRSRRAQPIDRAETAAILYRALHVSSWSIAQSQPSTTAWSCRP